MNGKDIKKIRKAFKVSQRGLANLLGLSIRTVQSWETKGLGHRFPSDESVEKINALVAKGAK